ncbi:MAG: hypothetical protein KJ879_02605 [Nanoarchaeota archaeon]|nr:hypothetical protein [Nanoarchaeota archaeon]
MKKLTIVGKTNSENKFYIKARAEEKSIEVIKKIIKELGSEYFVDNQIIPKTNNYQSWKDRWIPFNTNKIEADIICGNKFIHIIFYKFPNFEFVNKVLDKYCVWAQPRYKKGFGPSGRLS